MNSNVYLLNSFDFLARSLARMQIEDHPIDIQAMTEDMNEEHRSWFCKRYAPYRQQVTKARKLELEH